MSKYNYSIYQVKEGEETRDIRFEPLERLLAAGGRVDRANYDLVYAGPFDTSVESEDEYDTIRQRMDEAGTQNLSAYIRKMALNGYVLKRSLIRTTANTPKSL